MCVCVCEDACVRERMNTCEFVCADMYVSIVSTCQCENVLRFVRECVCEDMCVRVGVREHVCEPVQM